MSHFFVDTNILLYAHSIDPQERAKREVARTLLDSADAALSVQVLQEFYVQATRPAGQWGLSTTDAASLIELWTRFPVQELSLAVLRSALDIHRRRRFSYWDCAIIAAARALGCETLYSEDMDHGQDVDGTLICNPFL